MDKNHPKMKAATKARRKHDSVILKQCAKYLRGIKSPVVMDVGAFRGKYLIAMRNENQHARLYGMEPMDENCLVLEEAGIKVYQYAAWSEAKRLHLYASNRHKDDKMPFKDCSAYKESATKFGMGLQNTVEVDADNIGAIIDDMDVGAVDLMHMNCEGAEYEVLTKNNEWLKSVKWLHLHMHTKCKAFLSDEYIKIREKICDNLRNMGFAFACGMTDMAAISHIVQLWKK